MSFDINSPECSGRIIQGIAKADLRFPRDRERVVFGIKTGNERALSHSQQCL